ncbi:MAG TPA: PspA/IM30 family protein [Mycobacteriales bacterium]|nr:PspA/IM30 family protein [Mycobacteriales bacterium]
MSLGARLSAIFGRRRGDDDPIAELDASYAQQSALLQQSRRGVADVVTARKRVELQVRSLEQKAARLESEAREALHADREDAARELLVRRAGLLQQAGALQPDLDRLQDQEGRLQESVQRLEVKVEAFRTQKETVKAGYSAAEAHSRIGAAYAGISEESADVGLALERARARTEQMQARADAADSLAAADSGALPWESAGESAERRLAALQAGDGVEAELARLRGAGGRLRGPGAAGPDAEAAR